MLSHSGSSERNYADSSFKLKRGRSQFDPVRFLEIKKSDILFQFNRELGFTGDEAETKFNFIVEIINHLKPLRSCKLQTFYYLEETIRLMPYTLRSITLFFMMPAIRGKTAWNHAWNCLAYYASRDLINPVKSINIPEHLILEAIEQEKDEEDLIIENHSINPDSETIENRSVEVQSFSENKEKSESGKPDRFNVFCKSMPLSIPKDHFKVFTENNSKNGKPFLTAEQLDAFIDRAFCGNTNLQKIRFNLDSREISAIRYVFYQFYNTYYFEYFETLQCRPAFIRLLTDNFEGWDFETVNENFNKKPKKTI
jgi:hypothetical protein